MKYKNVSQKRVEESEGRAGSGEKINSSPAEEAKEGKESRGSIRLSQQNKKGRLMKSDATFKCLGNSERKGQKETKG